MPRVKVFEVFVNIHMSLLSRRVDPDGSFRSYQCERGKYFYNLFFYQGTSMGILKPRLLPD